MQRPRSFKAAIESAGGGGAFVRIPFDVEKVFGRKRVKVRATIDGEPYRGSLVRMGEDCHVLGILKAIREKIGKSPGDTVAITVQEDAAPRVIEVPADLRKALAADAAAKARYDSLSYSHKREYVGHILEAKREETRRRRVARTIEMLRMGPLV